jgi:arginyl-tRNA synthetase
MADLRSECGVIVAKALNIFIKNKGFEVPEVEASSLLLETPPNPEMGDVGIPLFAFAKTLRMGPPVIASELVKIIEADLAEEAAKVGSFVSVGPYVNAKLNKSAASSDILGKIQAQGDNYGSLNGENKKPLEGKKVMLEFSSPNTNKPLHLGHLRNDALGESVSRILKKAGAEVFKVNIINNRGVHICKSMLAYIINHSGNPEYVTETGISPDFKFTLKDTPETLGVKSDRFVGDCYVEFEKLCKPTGCTEEEEKALRPKYEAIAQSMLVEWEKGNEGRKKSFHAVYLTDIPLTHTPWRYIFLTGKIPLRGIYAK